VLLENAHKADLEDNLIPDELRRFDGFMEPEMYSASTALFPSRDFQLTVFDVNRKTFENVLGVDLIYWDVTHDVFTMVQYKRFERQNDGSGLVGRWAYHRKEDIAKQLAQMPKLTNHPTTSHDWRMTQSPFWFKFVNGDAARTQDGRLLSGMYVPADYLRLAMEDGSRFRRGHNMAFASTTTPSGT